MTSKRLHKRSDQRAEPGELEGWDRRTKIRNKARDIFIRYGYRKTTIEGIGKACGLVKTSLYHYFSSKEDIFADVVRVESENVLARIRAAVKATDDPKAQLIAMVKTRFKVIGDIIGESIGHEAAMEREELLPLCR